MPKILLFFSWLTLLLAPSGETAVPVRAIPGTAGLALIARAPEGFALASDGGSANADGTFSEARKIFPVGKYGALALAGTISLQDPVNRPFRQEVNIAALASRWLEAHPEAGLQAAHRALDTMVEESLAKFFAERDPGTEGGQYKFALLFAGFEESQPLVVGTRYFLPKSKGGPARTEAISGDMQPGSLWVLGQPDIAKELTGGRSKALAEFKAERAVIRFRKAHPADISSDGFLDLFDTILRASESTAGKKFVHESSIVRPPNRFAVIAMKEGFRLAPRP